MNSALKICIIIICAAVFAAVSFAAFAGASQEITVSAAMSLKGAFQEIGRLYESKHKNTKVFFNFGASGDLVRQISGGAPVDVFAAAAQKDMEDVSAKGLVLPGTRADFVKNRIVLVTPADSTLKTFEELSSNRIKRIAAGNPRTSPAGRYAAEVFDYYKITAAIKEKLIYAETVRQVLDYVARGEVDAGIVYATEAIVRSKEVRIASEASEASHKPVLYPIAVVTGTKNESGARDFIGMVRSKEGEAILKKHGFSIP
jgi:molybdate transport system substrate-binding protein